MKAFKKLMAAALVCVMALTMLTGCAVSDNLVENAVSAVSYKHKTDLDDEAQKAWDENKKATSGQITIGTDKVVYNFVIVKKPGSKATDKDSWGTQAKEADKILATSATNSDKKIEIGVKVVGDDYVAIVAKAAKK